jgi:hypothetical protein
MMLTYVSENFDMSKHPIHHVGNTSLSILHHTVQREWKIVRFNDMSHLERMPQAPDLMSAPPDDAEIPVLDADWPAKPYP